MIEKIYMIGCLSMILFGLSFVVIIYADWIKQAIRRRRHLKSIMWETGRNNQ